MEKRHSISTNICLTLDETVQKVTIQSKILLKESLNSDGQQFHQYQQSPFMFTHRTYAKTTTYDVRNPCPVLGHTQRYDGDKLVNGIPNLLSW